MSGRSAVLRRAVARDAGAVARRLAISWRETYEGLLPDDLLNARDFVRDSAELRELFTAGPPSGGIIAISDVDVIGFSTFGPPNVDDGSGLVEIYATYAAPGSGVGRSLLLRTVREARRSGATGLLWYVHSGNEPARRMIERRFEPRGDPIGRRWYGHPVEVVEYRWEW